MRLPGLDVVFGVAASAVEVFVERAGVALLQVGDDEAAVGSFHADFAASDDPFDPAPTLGGVIELLETPQLAALRGGGLEPRLRAGFETLDIATQGRGRRDAEDIVDAVRPTPVENFRAATVAVGAQQDFDVGPVSADGAHEPAQEGLDLLPLGRLAGRSTAVTKRPSPSNTTIG